MGKAFREKTGICQTTVDAVVTDHGLRQKRVHPMSGTDYIAKMAATLSPQSQRDLLRIIKWAQAAESHGGMIEAEGDEDKPKED